eukprot:TRINITY_DN4635_c0_g1_i1.p1 TRINITY_DN4635_c0_g1~~TRINITY_DN4635_c0_g1_i1.p1  ORF type:complete len:1320 (-),score=276.81 TRINITY_DN4635_c0_g1_i1:92-4051(-)
MAQRLRLERIASADHHSTTKEDDQGLKSAIVRPGHHNLSAVLRTPTDGILELNAKEARLWTEANTNAYVQKLDSGQRITVPMDGVGVTLETGDIVGFSNDRAYRVTLFSSKPEQTTSTPTITTTHSPTLQHSNESQQTQENVAMEGVENTPVSPMEVHHGNESEPQSFSQTQASTPNPVLAEPAPINLLQTTKEAHMEDDEEEREQADEAEGKITSKVKEEKQGDTTSTTTTATPTPSEQASTVDDAKPTQHEQQKQQEQSPLSGVSAFPLGSTSPQGDQSHDTKLIDLTANDEMYAQMLAMQFEEDEQARIAQEQSDANFARTLILLGDDGEIVHSSPTPVHPPVASSSRKRRYSPTVAFAAAQGVDMSKVKSLAGEVSASKSPPLKRVKVSPTQPAPVSSASFHDPRSETYLGTVNDDPWYYDLTSGTPVPVYSPERSMTPYAQLGGTPQPISPTMNGAFISPHHFQYLSPASQYFGVPSGLAKGQVGSTSLSPTDELGMLFRQQQAKRGGLLPGSPYTPHGMPLDAASLNAYARGYPVGVDGSVPDMLTDGTVGRRMQEDDLKKLLDFMGDGTEYADTLPPPELAVQLHDYQRVALGWMTKRESVNQDCRGGILADDMGCGKTVETIACMLANKREGAQRTLIVAPVSLVFQWKHELENKCKGVFTKIHIFHGTGKSISVKDLKACDAVITTYNTLAFQTIPPKENSRQKVGPLLQVRWYRTVLDEAHLIKNRNTRAAAACCLIQSKVKWCLSGTPIQNGLSDLYSLLKFLNYEPYCFANVWAEFVAAINSNPETGFVRLRAILKAICLRRRKEDKFNGKPLIRLPEKHIFEEEFEFTPPERDFYNALEKASQLQFNEYLRRGVVMQHYSEILVLLLRLRQACSHPSLVVNGQKIAFLSPDGEADGDGKGTQQEKETEKEKETEDGDPTKFSFEVLRRVLENKDIECSICLDVRTHPVATPCGHIFCSECLSASVETRAECPLCRTAIGPKSFVLLSALRPQHQGSTPSTGGEPLVTGDEELGAPSLGDILTLPSILDPSYPVIKPEKQEKETEKEKEEKQTETNTGKGKEKRVEEEEEEEDEDHLRLHQNSTTTTITTTTSTVATTTTTTTTTTTASKKNKGKERAGDDVEKFELISLKSSTKLEQLHRKLLVMLKEDEQNKGIVFSQWTSMLDIVASHMDSWGIKYERIDGTMTMRQRDQAVQNFTKNDTIPIMLLSLKVGGLGLNLTMARYVFLLDLWWNPATEDQAIDRVHRLGQTRPVIVYRLTIKNTVEARIKELQQKKKEIAEGALGTGAVTNTKLTLDDLKLLFSVSN